MKHNKSKHCDNCWYDVNRAIYEEICMRCEKVIDSETGEEDDYDPPSMFLFSG